MHAPLIHLQHTDSTNNELRRRLEHAQAPDGTAVLADFQTKGRGRRGRAWQSAPADNILCLIWKSLDISLPEIQGISLLPALAVLDVLDALGVHASCKWPNDVRIQGRKVCGILTECLRGPADAIAGVIIGIGINVASALELVPDKICPPPISLFEASGFRFDRIRLCRGLQQALESRVNLWRRGLRPELFAEWVSRCDHVGSLASITVNGCKTVGRMCGLDASGQLLFQVGDHVCQVWADDLEPYGNMQTFGRAGQDQNMTVR